MSTTRRRWTEEEFREAVRQNVSRRGVIQQLGLKDCGGNYRTVNLFVKTLGLDTSHWTGQGHGQGLEAAVRVNTIPLKDILVEHSTYTSSSHLKARLLKEGILKEKCVICGLENMWNGDFISLELDHINGEHTDNRLHNLRILCPNCHSQQKTSTHTKIPHTNYVCRDCGQRISRSSKSGFCLKCVVKYRKKRK